MRGECPDYKVQLAPLALTLHATYQEDNSQRCDFCFHWSKVVLVDNIWPSEVHNEEAIPLSYCQEANKSSFITLIVLRLHLCLEIPSPGMPPSQPCNPTHPSRKGLNVSVPRQLSQHEVLLNFTPTVNDHVLL